jgi:hypothetical protein
MSNVTSERGETQSPVAQVKEQVQDAAARETGPVGCERLEGEGRPA